MAQPQPTVIRDPDTGRTAPFSPPIRPRSKIWKLVKILLILVVLVFVVGLVYGLIREKPDLSKPQNEVEELCFRVNPFVETRTDCSKINANQIKGIIISILEKQKKPIETFIPDDLDFIRRKLDLLEWQQEPTIIQQEVCKCPNFEDKFTPIFDRLGALEAKPVQQVIKQAPSQRQTTQKASVPESPLF